MKERQRRLRLAQYKTELRAYKILATHRGVRRYFKEGKVPNKIVYNILNLGFVFAGDWKDYSDLIMNYADFSILDVYDEYEGDYELYLNEWIKWAIKETKKDIKKLKKR